MTGAHARRNGHSPGRARPTSSDRRVTELSRFGHGRADVLGSGRHDRPRPGADAFDRLADELSDHGAADIRDFADHLARALYALDTPAHYRAAPPALVPARTLRGRGRRGEPRTGRCCAPRPSLTSYANRPGHAVAARRGAGLPDRHPGAWEHRTPVSHETGSNADAWRDSWLHPLMGTTTRDGRAPQAYMIALQHVARHPGHRPGLAGLVAAVRRRRVRAGHRRRGTPRPPAAQRRHPQGRRQGPRQLHLCPAGRPARARRSCCRSPPPR